MPFEANREACTESSHELNSRLARKPIRWLSGKLRQHASPSWVEVVAALRGYGYLLSARRPWWKAPVNSNQQRAPVQHCAHVWGCEPCSCCAGKSFARGIHGARQSWQFVRNVSARSRWEHRNSEARASSEDTRNIRREEKNTSEQQRRTVTCSVVRETPERPLKATAEGSRCVHAVGLRSGSENASVGYMLMRHALLQHTHLERCLPRVAICAQIAEEHSAEQNWNND